jgi:anti-sigma regulatory factor (Ser/Thr protein kinase)
VKDLVHDGDGAADASGLVLPSTPPSITLARQYAVMTCTSLGWGDSAETVALLVSEVVTNAILHCNGAAFLIRVLDRGPRLRVEVLDESPRLPVPRGAVATAENGRGLALVATLAIAWGVDGREDGKTFWFELGA